MANSAEKPYLPLHSPHPPPPPLPAQRVIFSNLLSLSTLVSDVDNYVDQKMILNHRGNFSV